MKIYLMKEESTDYNSGVRAFRSKEDAMQAWREAVAEFKEEKPDTWDELPSEEGKYEAYLDGWAAADYYRAEVVELTVE